MNRFIGAVLQVMGAVLFVIAGAEWPPLIIPAAISSLSGLVLWARRGHAAAGDGRARGVSFVPDEQREGEAPAEVDAALCGLSGGAGAVAAPFVRRKSGRYRPFFSTAWAAASRATGTRNGEADT